MAMVDGSGRTAAESPVKSFAGGRSHASAHWRGQARITAFRELCKIFGASAAMRQTQKAVAVAQITRIRSIDRPKGLAMKAIICFCSICTSPFACRILAGTSYDGLEISLSISIAFPTPIPVDQSGESTEKRAGGTAAEGPGRVPRGIWERAEDQPVGRHRDGATYTVAGDQRLGRDSSIYDDAHRQLGLHPHVLDDERDRPWSAVGDFLPWAGKVRQDLLPGSVRDPGSASTLWPMPFRHKAKISIPNSDDKAMTSVFQVDYALYQPQGRGLLPRPVPRVILPYKQFTRL